MGFFWGLVSKPPLYRGGREKEREKEREKGRGPPLDSSSYILGHGYKPKV